MIFGEITSNYSAPIGFAAWASCLFFTVALVNAGLKLSDRLTGKNKSIGPQPFSVEIAKQLHEQFADKTVFEEHVKSNTARHGQLFAEIDRVERAGRAELDRRFNELNKERAASLEKLNTEFVFIRENIAGINRELKIRNEQH